MIPYKVHVIIVTYNGSLWIKKCISRVLASDIPVQIIVIDNHSDDNTIDIIEQNFSTVELFKSTQNLGFGKANNIGLKTALERDADFVFLLNQDVYIEPDTISKLIDCYKIDNSYGILSPFHLEETAKKFDYNFGNYIQKNEHLKDAKPNDKFSQDIYEVPFVNAAAWLITEDCLKKVGGFDPLFPHYGEDEDYAARVKYHRLKIGVVSNTFIRHCRNQNPVNTGSYKRVLIRSLINSKSLRNSFIGNYSKIIYRNQKEALSRIIKGELAQGLTYLKVNARLILLVGKIFTNVKKSKSGTKPFLN